jgi:hypothetical protein
MLGEHKLEIHFSRVPDCRSIRKNLHAVRNRLDAGRRQSARAFYFDQANPASADSVYLFHVTQRGYINRRRPARFQNRRARVNTIIPAVYLYIYIIHL